MAKKNAQPVFEECDDTRKHRFKNLEIEKLEIMPEVQIRPLDMEHVDTMINALIVEHPLPPLSVFYLPSDKRYYLTDGFHRMEAFRQYNDTIKISGGEPKNVVPCDITQGFETDTIDTVIKMTCLSNSKNAKRWTTPQNYKRIMMYYSRQPGGIKAFSKIAPTKEICAKFSLSQLIISNALQKYNDGEIDENGNIIKKKKEGQDSFPLEEEKQLKITTLKLPKKIKDKEDAVVCALDSAVEIADILAKNYSEDVKVGYIMAMVDKFQEILALHGIKEA